MHEIICPHCHKAFKIDEAGYADILKQVRDHDFEQQLYERLEMAEQDKRNAIELATTKVTSELQKQASAKEVEIQQLKARLEAGEVAQKLAVSEALSTIDVDANRKLTIWGCGRKLGLIKRRLPGFGDARQGCEHQVRL